MAIFPPIPGGGLKSFGHPIGASGVRMVYESVQLLSRRSGERQVRDPRGAPRRRIAGDVLCGRDGAAVTGERGIGSGALSDAPGNQCTEE